MEFRVYSEEDFAGGFVIEAENLKEAENNVLNLIDIQEEEYLKKIENEE